MICVLDVNIVDTVNKSQLWSMATLGTPSPITSANRRGCNFYILLVMGLPDLEDIVMYLNFNACGNKCFKCLNVFHFCSLYFTCYEHTVNMFRMLEFAPL
jgi:hypothetical protein